MPVVTVSQLNNYIKRYFDQNAHLSDIWVKGEISNYKSHYSGHIYITLKDEGSTLKAVMFKSSASKLKFEPSDGMKIVAFGKVGVYEAGGTYQLYIDSMIPDGKGELYAAYEQLKEKLTKEGLFLPEHKKPLPSFPKKVGVVSSMSGAALRDVLNVLKRRYPICDVLIYPAKVQGIGASDSICDGLKYFSDSNSCDVIILARGGGSIEDLWAFNEEKTVRAIFECNVPVITGVGHETDYTLCDFVADFRAPTPSAAAEISVPSKEELYSYIQKIKQGSFTTLSAKIRVLEEKLKRHSSEHIYNNLLSKIENYDLVCKNLSSACHLHIENLMSDKLSKFNTCIASLEAMNPFYVLKRGYTIAQTSDGELFNFNHAEKDATFNLVFDGGMAECIVRRVNHETKN